MTDRKLERVELVVANMSGVLGRVAGHIRREGWNIKRLFVDETGDGKTSRMEIDIEGAHTKLAQVMERLLGLDCVLSIAMDAGGKRLVRERRPAAPETAAGDRPAVKAPPKPAGAFRVLAVNPGSTTTKFAVYDNESVIIEETAVHGEEFRGRGILEQMAARRDRVLERLAGAGIEGASLDAVAGRGGLIKPIESGVYRINRRMLSDLESAAASHASSLGAIIASEIAGPLGIPAFVVDPIVVDEMDRFAKMTGMPGVERNSVFHALNQKAIARRLAARMGRPYENARFVVAHLGGGITVGAHRYGRVIDVNDALAGEGPFTPERSGAIPALPLIRMCFSGEYTQEEMVEKVTRKGGVLAYLGTADIRKVQKMINDGDEFAALVLDSMAYQVAKEIGAMAAVLEGRVDAIILTGGLARSTRFTGSIKQRVDTLAPVHVFPGEDELLALMEGALRVLRGEEAAAVYG